MKINISEIITKYNSGQSINAIAKEYEVFPPAISRILEKNGVILRHDTKRKGTLYVKDGEKLIKWAKSQGRLVTKAELAKIIGTKRLSPSYFEKYPELGKYVETHKQSELKSYYNQLYKWLKDNHIPYKPNDRTKLGVSLDALLLKEYSHIGIQIKEKPYYMSEKMYEKKLSELAFRAKTVGIEVVYVTKESFENLEDLKVTLDFFKKEIPSVFSM